MYLLDTNVVFELRRPDRDALIAATALVQGLILVTRNEADSVGTGARLLNPWTAPAL